MLPSILLLTPEKKINNRPVINDLWCRLIPEAGVNVFWVPHSKGFQTEIQKMRKNSFILLGKGPDKGTKFYKFIISVAYKLRIANFLVKKGLVNQIQVRNGITDGLISLLLRIIYGIPYSFHLSSLHGFEDSSFLTSRERLTRFKYNMRIIFYPFIYGIIFHFASLIQPISKYMGDYLVKNTRIDKNKLFPLPVSTTVNQIDFSHKRQLSPNPVIVYSGSLDKSRGLDLLLEVFSLINKKHPHARFRIIGIVEKSTDLEILEEEIRGLNLDNKLELILNLKPNKVRSRLFGCDIGISLVKPNNRYKVSTPSKMAEYLSCGLPVVCNKEIMDQEKIIFESNAGISVECLPNKFANAVSRIISDSDLFSYMSNSGKEWIFRNRTYDILTEPLINRYIDIS